MADSVGGPVFPRTGIQEGHTHFDKENNILYVYNGGIPSNPANWSVIGGSGSSGGGGGDASGNQRWSFFISGVFISGNGFGDQVEILFVAPVAGVVSAWAMFVGVETMPDDVIMELVSDPFGLAPIEDSDTILTGSFNQVAFIRTVSVAMAAGDMIMVRNANNITPENLRIVINGYIDFVPNS